MTEYVRFVERNEHEGETWTFWLERAGNEDALAALAELLATIYHDDKDDANGGEFALDDDVTLGAHDVNVLVKYGGGGYMTYHQRVNGRLVLTPELRADPVGALYKGGVRRLFETEG